MKKIEIKIRILRVLNLDAFDLKTNIKLKVAKSEVTNILTKKTKDYKKVTNNEMIETKTKLIFDNKF